MRKERDFDMFHIGLVLSVAVKNRAETRHMQLISYPLTIGSTKKYPSKGATECVCSAGLSY